MKVMPVTAVLVVSVVPAADVGAEGGILKKIVIVIVLYKSHQQQRFVNDK